MKPAYALAAGVVVAAALVGCRRTQTASTPPFSAGAGRLVESTRWPQVGSDLEPDPGASWGALDNGLRFVIMPDSTTQLVQVDVRYEVGAKEDPIGKAGIAHLVEHLIFQQRPPAADGTETPPLFQQISDKTIIFNAYTNWDTTHYMMLQRNLLYTAVTRARASALIVGNEGLLRRAVKRASHRVTGLRSALARSEPSNGQAGGRD